MLSDIPRKANRVLQIIFVCFLAIAMRIAYLTIVEHEIHLEKAKLPRRRVQYVSGERGTIRDRFNYPLAINRIEYDATIIYSHIKEIPRVVWEREGRKKKKVYKRREYVYRLAALLAEKLDIPQQEIIDGIYARAVLFPNTPHIVKKGIDEKTFYALKMCEHRYPGIQMRQSSVRYYPMGKVAGDIIGYIGSINRHQFYKVTNTIRTLEIFLEKRQAGDPALLPLGYTSAEEVSSELKRLKEKAYSVTSFVGKSGLEYAHDDTLRGSIGYVHYEVDTSGRKVKELPTKKKPRSGSRIVLNLSYELQAYAESLLATHEAVRNKEFSTYGKTHGAIPNPWIKGGSIVALIPGTGEIVAMASYPRFDPTPFTALQKDPLSIHAELETTAHQAHIWDGLAPLKREKFSQKNGFYTEKAFLTWEQYLHMVVSPKSKLWDALSTCSTVGAAHTLLTSAQKLLDLSEQPSMKALLDTLYSQEKTTPHTLVQSIERSLMIHAGQVASLRVPLDLVLEKIPHIDDKLLLLDLLRLTALFEALPHPLPPSLALLSLDRMRDAAQEYAVLSRAIEKKVRTLFHETVFEKWRNASFRDYLKKKRKEEQERGTYEHPYDEYLHDAEKKLFAAFWKEQRQKATLSLLSDEHTFIFQDDLRSLRSTLSHDATTLTALLQSLSRESRKQLLHALPTYDALDAPLYGKYSLQSKRKGPPLLKDLATAFYPKNGYGFARSTSYQHAAPQGSLFKVLTAYQGIFEKFQKGNPHDLNPLTIIDETHPGGKEGLLLGYTEDGKPIPRKYKGGTLPRSHASIGKTDLFTAMEQSSNVYFSLLAGDILNHPESIRETAEAFGFGKKTGVELPHEFSGILPHDLRFNRTGLYAFAIGQHEFSCTPLQSARFFSTVVNKGVDTPPSIIKVKTAMQHDEASPLDASDYEYKDLLASIHCHFPYFSEAIKNHTRVALSMDTKAPSIAAPFPDQVHDYLLESMRRVVSEKKGSAHPFRIRGLYRDPTLLRSYLTMKPYMIGKSSTAEFRVKHHLNRDQPPIICQDIWFGGACYKEPLTKHPFVRKTRWDKPELVVIVYLRYGDYGKEAAPLAAQVMQKWREIVKKEGKSSCLSTQKKP